MSHPDDVEQLDGHGRADEAPVSRRAQIIRLLETRDDGLPEKKPKKLARAGFVHNALVRETCSDCLANDRRMVGCETCRGSGYIERVRTRDPMAENTVLPYGMDVTVQDRRRERDAEIDRLDAKIRQQSTAAKDELEAANQHPYPWETARRRMYRSYDYAALDAALELLRYHDEAAYHLVHSVYVYGWSEASTTTEALLERALRFVDERLPDPIRAPGFEHPAEAKVVSKRRAA